MIPQCPPCAASTRELGQRRDETPALLPACQAGALCPEYQKMKHQVTQEGKGIAIHLQTNRISNRSTDKGPSEVSSKGSCNAEAEDQCLAQVPPLPPAAPPSHGETIPRSQRGSGAEQASVTLCQAK